MNQPDTTMSRLTRRARLSVAMVVAALALAQPLTAQPGLDRPPPRDPQPAPDDDAINFGRFSEPIDLSQLVDFISRTLDINIVLSDADLTGRLVEFRAPVTIERVDLLPMLETLLAQHNMGLTQTDEGLIMIAPTERLPVQVGGDLATTRVFPTPLVKPSSLQAAINALLGDAGAGRKIAYLDELGVIISTAPPRLNRSLETVINLLLSEQQAIGLHSFALTHIAAEDAMQRVLEFAGQSRGAPGPSGAPQAGAGAGGAPGAGTLVSQAFANLADRLVIDRQSNGLILRGSESEARELARLIEMVDQPSRIVIKRYNAGAMSPVIAEYGARLGLGPVSTAGQAQARASFIGSGFTVEESDSGAFTYYGTVEQHERVAELVEEFAEQVRNEQMVVEFYRLEHADAEEAAELLTELLELDAADEVAESPFVTRSLESTGGPGVRPTNITQRGTSFVDPTTAPGAQAPTGQAASPAGPTGAPAPVGGAPAGEASPASLTPAEGIAIIADTARNQLMVRAPVRQQREIAQVIEKIDQRRPQVYLEATILAVDNSRSFSISVETVISDPDSDFPVFTNFGLLSDPKDVGDVRVPFGQGLSSAIIKNDYVPILLQTLATEGNAQVQSTPRLLVNDNETANLASTENQPFAQTSQSVGTPTQTSLGGQVSAGTTVSVTPHISSGGYVQLELQLELSSFGERFSDDLPPPTNSDTVDSIITVPSDSTVVIGGLTTEQLTDTVRKVPLLGDIPGVGFLFRSTTKTRSERTFYIFITPRIMRDPGFADLRLLTRGPAAEMKVDLADAPPLEPAFMEIFSTAPRSARAADPEAPVLARRDDE